jgi:hypothetical protein
MTAAPWVAPDDLDPECLHLCAAMNALPGVFTVESCCGHGRRPYWIFFRVRRLTALPRVLYWFDGCHSGVYGWRVDVHTDCAMSPVTFCAEGPAGPAAYLEAKVIAAAMAGDDSRWRLLLDDLKPAPGDRP